MTAGASALAFDVGGTTMRCALVTGERLQGRTVRASVRGDALAPAMAAMAADVLARAGSSFDAVPTIGISVPGPLSADRRSVAFTGNLRLRNYPLAELLEAQVGCPVAMDDDANCAALAEARFGVARGTRSSVTLVVGTGVGSGIVLGGDIHRGAHALAGEVGHIRVAPGGRRCSCGRQGCLEAMVSGAALLDRAGAGFATVGDVVAAVDAGDERACEAIGEVAEYIAVGVAALASIVDPECVVLTGGIGRQQADLRRGRFACAGLLYRAPRRSDRPPSGGTR